MNLIDLDEFLFPTADKDREKCVAMAKMKKKSPLARHRIRKFFLFLPTETRKDDFPIWTRSLMDKIKDSGSFALGSIPSGFTKNNNEGD